MIIAAAGLVPAALLLAACAGAPPAGEGASPADPPSAEVARLPCQNTAAAILAAQSELRQYATDHHGRDVEVWCYRGLLRSHWDVRVGWDELVAGRPVHRTATIAGCFFDDGHSTGPGITEDAAGRFATVQWTNRDPANQHKQYRFSYDFAAGTVTITGSIPGAPEVTKVVAAQPGWEELKTALPFPPD